MSQESDKLLPQQAFGKACAMTRKRYNDTSSLNAHRHWVARHQHEESAGLFVEIRQIGIMTLFQSGLVVAFITAPMNLITIFITWRTMVMK